MPATRVPAALVDYDVAIATRDQILLLSDVYRPAGENPAPTILQRTPYGRAVTEHLDYSVDLLRAVRSGWNVVVQDVRGRGGSGGVFDPFRHESDDGHDTVDWIANQPWSDGAVVMAGGSYLGATQWLAALSGHRGLRAIAPALTPDDYYDGWVHDGGALRLGFLAHWLYESLWAGLAQRSDVIVSPEDVRAELAAVLAAPGRCAAGPDGALVAPYLATWNAHPTRDSYWAAVSPRDRLADIVVPAFVTAGWFDVFGRGAIDSFVRLREVGSTRRVREQSRLVVGPWTHGQFAGTYVDVDFGPDATARAIDLTGLQLRWFERVVRDERTAPDDDPPVRVFVMGLNRWCAFRSWPPPAAQPLELALASEPAVLGADDVGLPGSRTIEHVPSDPVPTVGGSTFLHGRQLALNAGPRDQAALDGRDDILRYDGAPLTEPVQIIGRVAVRLSIACDQPDANISAKLVVVPPDDRAWGLVDGSLRLSHRDGDEASTPLQPARIYAVEFTLGHTAVTVPAGARLRLDLAASNFPQIADVGDTGSTGAGEELLPQRVTVHTGGSHGSQLVLDVVSDPLDAALLTSRESAAVSAGAR